MKKTLAVLLAVVMAFSVCVVCVSAEGDGETASGTTYTWSEDPGLGSIDTHSPDETMEVVILQAGDTIEFGEVTAKTTATKFRTIEVIYNPDAASINAANVGNVHWKETMTPKYNLDSEKWNLGDGQETSDLMAKSPNYYKTFYTKAQFQKGEIACAKIVGPGDLAHARDSVDVDRGSPDGEPIDFALSGSKFLGWALYTYGSWKPSGTGTLRIEVYALWDRGAAPEQKPDNPDDPGEPTEYATPIQETLAKWMAKIAEIFEYLSIVSGVPAALTLLLDGGVRSWLYKLFGIEA